MSASAREFQVLVRHGENLRDRMTVLERCCQRSNINYLPPDLLEPDDGIRRNPTVLIEYRQPGMGKNKGLVPVIAARWTLARDSERNERRELRDALKLTTGFRHVTWARPILTDDTTLEISRARACFDPVEIDAFFERSKILALVHQERIRLLNKLATEREALDFYFSLFRAIGAMQRTSRNRMPRSARTYLALFPGEGERLSWLEHLSFLTGACRSRDPWVVVSEFGRITDHLIQGLEPLHQNGKRITFRLGVRRK